MDEGRVWVMKWRIWFSWIFPNLSDFSAHQNPITQTPPIQVRSNRIKIDMKSIRKVSKSSNRYHLFMTFFIGHFMEIFWWERNSDKLKFKTHKPAQASSTQFLILIVNTKKKYFSSKQTLFLHIFDKHNSKSIMVDTESIENVKCVCLFNYRLMERFRVYIPQVWIAYVRSSIILATLKWNMIGKNENLLFFDRSACLTFLQLDAIVVLKLYFGCAWKIIKNHRADDDFVMRWANDWFESLK